MVLDALPVLLQSAPVALLPLAKQSFPVCSLALKPSGVSRRAQCPLMHQPGAFLISLLWQEMGAQELAAAPSPWQGLC